MLVIAILVTAYTAFFLIKVLPRELRSERPLWLRFILFFLAGLLIAMTVSDWIKVFT